MYINEKNKILITDVIQIRQYFFKHAAVDFATV